MPSLNELLEREGATVDLESGDFERLIRRRDRKRRNRRIAAGVVGMAFFVALVWVMAAGGAFDRTQTPVVPGGAGTGQTETGPAVTGPAGAVDRGENPEPPPLVEPVPIGTVTQSRAGCALEIVADPVPSGAGRLSLVNEMKRWVSFELLRFDPDVLTFAQFGAMVANGEYRGSGPFVTAPPGVFVLAQGEVGPGASGIITDNLATGDAFAVLCLDQRHSPTPGDPSPGTFALVGPIVVP